jgi:hypothetical protein
MYFYSGRQVQARAVGSHELLLPELLEHVRQHEQEGCRQGELRQWWVSDLAHQAVLDRRGCSKVSAIRYYVNGFMIGVGGGLGIGWI